MITAPSRLDSHVEFERTTETEVRKTVWSASGTGIRVPLGGAPTPSG